MKTKASELIEDLQALIKEHGDLPIYVRADDYGWLSNISFEKSLGRWNREEYQDGFVIEA